MGELDGHWAPSFRDCSMDVDMVTDFFARIGENWHTHLHSVRCHSTMNRRNTKEMHGLTVCIIRLRLTKIK